LKQLLERIGVKREDVPDWVEAAGTPQRERILREVLRPAPTTDAWRALAEGNIGELTAGLNGLSLVKAADPAEEASVIALLLREALETPSHTAALVTRDRALARRVTAELGRWDIAIDDSAGRPLAQTEVGAFLCLIAEAADSGFAPVPLLALLKHPLATMGEDAAVFRGRARELDLKLRGPRPNSGLDGNRSPRSRSAMPWRRISRRRSGWRRNGTYGAARRASPLINSSGNCRMRRRTCRPLKRVPMRRCSVH
jgi:ATP-dependent helicase/nuclease subunit B